MKVIVKTGKLSMTITGTPGVRPTIEGDLWDIMSKIPIDAWLSLFGRVPVYEYPELDLIEALMRDPASDVKVIEPLVDWTSSKGIYI
jgi:hypothetical protein